MKYITRERFANAVDLYHSIAECAYKKGNRGVYSQYKGKVIRTLEENKGKYPTEYSAFRKMFRDYYES